MGGAGLLRIWAQPRTAAALTQGETPVGSGVSFFFAGRAGSFVGVLLQPSLAAALTQGKRLLAAGPPRKHRGNTPSARSVRFASDGASRRPIACIAPFGETHPFVPFGAISLRDCATSQQVVQSRSEIALSVSQMAHACSERAPLGPVWNNLRREGPFQTAGGAGRGSRGHCFGRGGVALGLRGHCVGRWCASCGRVPAFLAAMHGCGVNKAETALLTP